MDKISLLYGNLPLAKERLKDANVIHLSDHGSPFAHHLKKSSTHLIQSLKEKVHQAILILESEKDIKRIHSILQKAQSDNANVVIVLPATKADLISKIPSSYLITGNVRLAILGELIGRVLESDVSKIFQKAIGTGAIEVEFGGEQQLAVVSEDDANRELEKCLSSKNDSKILLLFYEKPQTVHAAAIEIAKAFPGIEIVYRKNPKIPEVNHAKIIKDLTIQFGKKPSYANTQGFAHCIKELSNLSEKGQKIQKQKIRKKPKLKKHLKFASLSLLLFFLVTLGITTIGIIRLKTAQKAFSNADLERGQQALVHAQQLFSLTYPTTSIITSLLPIDNTTKEMIFSSDNTLVLAIKTITQLENALRNQNFQNNQKAISQLTYAYFKFSQFPALTGGGVLGENTSKIASILQGYTDIHGIRGEGQYLILFQNNAELRPTGGFIGSVGQLQMNDGKITNFTIRDVYQLDGQLQVHYEPHYIVRRYLQPHLFLRDSNFSIEFDTAAQKAAQIYESQTGKKVDGVIAVDFEVVKTLLKHTGKIELPEHNLILTPERSREVIHEAIHENEYAGSSKKKDVLQSLMTKLLLKIESDPTIASAFAKEIPYLLEQKHILFSFQDNFIQSLFSVNGYTGSINDQRGDGDNIINDIFGWNEANIGVNKANEHISRKVEYEVYMGKNNIVSKASLNILNTSKNAEDYKVYIRLIAAKESTLESITINGVEQQTTTAVTDPEKFETPNFIPPQGLEVDERREDEYKTFGFITNVPKGRTQNIEALYVQEDNSVVSGKYSLLYVKQPGTSKYPLNASITFNNNQTATSHDFDVQRRVARFSGNASSDKVLEIEFSR